VFLLSNVSFLLLLVAVVALSVLPILGIVDVWSKQRFTSVQTRVLWTVGLVIIGLPALIAYVIVLKLKRRELTAAI